MAFLCFLSTPPSPLFSIKKWSHITSPFILNDTIICFMAFLDVFSTKNGYQKNTKKLGLNVMSHLLPNNTVFERFCPQQFPLPKVSGSVGNPLQQYKEIQRNQGGGERGAQVPNAVTGDFKIPPFGQTMVSLWPTSQGQRAQATKPPDERRMKSTGRCQRVSEPKNKIQTNILDSPGEKHPPRPYRVPRRCSRIVHSDKLSAWPTSSNLSVLQRTSDSQDQSLFHLSNHQDSRLGLVLCWNCQKLLLS